LDSNRAVQLFINQYLALPKTQQAPATAPAIFPSFPLKLALLSDLDWIRTNGPHLRRMMLYPAELPDRNKAANPVNSGEDETSSQLVLVRFYCFVKELLSLQI
jgi:hypothetical protein